MNFFKDLGGSLKCGYQFSEIFKKVNKRYLELLEKLAAYFCSKLSIDIIQGCNSRGNDLKFGLLGLSLFEYCCYDHRNSGHISRYLHFFITRCNFAKFLKIKMILKNITFKKNFGAFGAQNWF